MGENSEESLMRILKQVIRQTMAAVQVEINSPKGRKRAGKLRPANAKEFSISGFTFHFHSPEKDPSDPTRHIDLVAEKKIIDSLKNSLDTVGIENYVVITEEKGVFIMGDYSESILYFFIDPIDSTDLALLAMGGAITISVVEKEEQDSKILTSVVGNLLTGEVFWSAEGMAGAYVENANGDIDQIIPSGKDDLKGAKISNFAPKIKRLRAWESKTSLINALGEEGRIILHHGGPVPICRVSCGDLDAVFEFQKGYKLIDLLPLFIAEKAGCDCSDLKGSRIKVQIHPKDWSDAFKKPADVPDVVRNQFFADLRDRQKFIIAATPTLGERLRELL